MIRAFIAALLVGSLTACVPSNRVASSKPLVLATTTLFADMARNVGGDRVTVDSIVPAGSHVEEYEPKPDDSKRIATAALIIENGLDLDRWAEPLLRDKKKETLVVTLTKGLPTIDDDNPHLWFDVQLARKYIEKIRDALIELDPGGRATYTNNAVRFDAELARLDTDVRAQITTIPRARRKLVTSHDAFPYYAKAYGLEVVGFAQPEPGKDPSPSELAELVKTIRSAGVPAIFSEVGVSPALAQTLAREAGVTKIIADLPTDSIVAPPADTYIGVIRTVTQKIADALR